LGWEKAFSKTHFYLAIQTITYQPVIPKGLIMLRLIPTALHTIEDVNRTLDAYSELAVKLKKGHYKEKSLQNS
jgi:glycine C-acetyltransferase